MERPRAVLQDAAEDPLALSQQLLQDIASIQVRPTKGDEIKAANPEQLSRLADSACWLKRADLSSLSALQLLAFWLNVYHALLLHGRLGTPGLKSLRSIVAFLNRTTYIVAGQPWSLTEIEHLILRKNSPVLGKMLYRWFLAAWDRKSDLDRAGCLMRHDASCGSRTDHWQQFQVIEDKRINFVLNCGTSSCASKVFVFGSGDIDAELDLACRDFFKEFPVTSGGSTNQLPATLKHYVKESPDGTPEGWLRIVHPFSQTSPGPATFRAYDWRLRSYLKLQQCEQTTDDEALTATT